MRKLLKILVITSGKILGPIFFDGSYLKGKWFDGKNKDLGWQGWLWVLQGIWFQKILGFNRRIKVPISYNFRLNSLKNLMMDPNELDNLQSPGCYFQNPDAKIYIGKDTKVGPNVCIITRNHDFEDLDSYTRSSDVCIGDGCWLGSNSIILPGINLGNKVIVAAGSVVTKSFDSNCVIGGNPARIIKKLE